MVNNIEIESTVTEKTYQLVGIGYRRCCDVPSYVQAS
jgi:hypothetical protein